MKKKIRKLNRSAITGRFVTKTEVKQKPHSTVTERTGRNK